MSDVVVRSVAAGRARLTVPWVRARPGSAGLVDERLIGMRGFRALRIFPRTGSVVIWMAPDLLDVDRLVSALDEAPPASAPAKPTRSIPDSSTGELARLVVGGAVLAIVALRRLLRRPRITAGSSGLLGAITLFTGLPFFRGALRSLRGRSHPGTDTLVTAATVISFVLRENVVALTVLWLLNIGEFLQTLTLRRTRRAIEELLTIGEERVWLVREEGVEVEVALEEVVPGDVVAVYEHHRIPVDGQVVGGEALVDQAAITGEALPVYARAGAEVYAGTIVTSGSLTVRATSVGRDTTVGRIISRVEEAQSDRAPIQTVATRFTRRFVPVSFALAGLTYVVTRDARRAMTMLLIACPCAAGLATPTAISAAIGNGARRGTLIKGGTHLEGIGRVTAVVFDKTGTLTFGRPLVTSVVTLSDRFTANEVLSLAASGELHARHPLAQAIVAHTEEQHLHAPIHQACEVVLGMGMRAELDGTRLLVGSPALLRQHGVELTDEAQGWTEQLRGGGETVICIAHDEDLIGLLGVSDAVRSGAGVVIQQLVELGVSRVLLLTGDAPETAQAVADTLGITEVHAHALPEGKLQLIRDLQAEGHTVAMVGDGTNDAPALALADVGISMGAHSSHVALETADIALPGDDLRQVPAVVELSRHTLRVVRQNYGLAIGVNLLGLVAGAGGSMNPVLAALLHNTSSIAVVGNSARLVNHTPHLPPTDEDMLMAAPLEDRRVR
ncbi:cation-transporting P-type ATPase C [Streptomyces sp. 2333.5]|uniref:heavy metal translocating P-type ATPase n=1 Tax=unclassified Streptomyces TaxID=2593676 RepID=UPI00089B6B95|nr:MULTISPECIES: cation-translocating P-type ATPase [unclassified Streptomyces]PJJ05993.1 cation-transporting P-type ATPase C [Streptomyces sp. 2333.5]SEE88265.1 cation-transporting P-type ATPase C [Streptomyces sp. 2314.4]SEF05817.1 cation-transporting P-type ATPase C [Streptomyces sp. 2112.2]